MGMLMIPTQVGGPVHSMGLEIRRRTTIPDQADIICTAAREIAERADVCICTGGLGPTKTRYGIESGSSSRR